ncbi:MAG: glycosyltransferase family 2 protein [Chloroflexota bacterium]
MNPQVSIIIPTYQREKPLRDTLSWLLEQSSALWELILVDQTPQHEAETEQMLHSLAKSGQLRLERLERPSLPAARNAGIRAAQGEIVLFLDDDIYPGPNLAALHLRHYVDAHIGSVAGRIHVSARPDPEGHPWPDGPNVFDRNRPGERAFAPGGHLSVRRELALQAGLFDENFISNAVSEEEDFGFAVRRLGASVVYDPEPWIIHLAAPSGGCREARDIRTSPMFYRNKFYFAVKNVAWPDFWRVLADTYRSSALRRPHFFRRQWAFLLGCWQGWQVYRKSGWRLKRLPYRVATHIK